MNTLKTYLVEDSPVIRDSLIETLEELVPVLVVGTAEDEASATQWLSQPGNRADLVIVDIFLKTGSGLGVLQTAGQWRTARHLVVLSNYATADMRRRCMELGAERVFDKSNEIDALIDYCEHLSKGGNGRVLLNGHDGQDAGANSHANGHGAGNNHKRNGHHDLDEGYGDAASRDGSPFHGAARSPNHSAWRVH
jgi:DNA-binding NarL/FixJ family response regulator